MSIERHLIGGEVKDQVTHILEKYPHTRDCDKQLWLAYMVLCKGLKESIGEEAYNKLKAILTHDDTATFESVTRWRRKLQEAGMYVGTKRTEKMQLSEDVRVWAKEKS
jgi:hypothetical protein